MDSTPELQNKHTIFGRVAGSTIYNVLALANVEISESEPDRPVYPPKLNRAEVVHNPFSDLVPRITPEERIVQNQAKAMAAERADSLKRKNKRPKKNVTLLSFGSEEDVSQEERSRKPMSSHDLLEDKRLSKKPHHDIQLKQENVSTENFRKGHINGPCIPEELNPTENVSQQVSETENLLSTPEIKPKQSSGRELLNSIVQQYKQDKKDSNPPRDLDQLKLLGSFQKNIREKTSVPKGQSELTRLSSESLWDDDANMHEYGAEDDDDVNWRSHRYVHYKLTPDSIQGGFL